MARRRKKTNVSINTTVSSPELTQAKKKKPLRMEKKQPDDDEASVVETLLSQNRYSTGGTAVNDSDLGDFGEVPEEEFQQGGHPPTKQAAATAAEKMKLPPLVVKKVPLDKLASKIAALNVSAEYKLTRVGTKVMVYTKPEYDRVCTLLKDSKVEFFTHDIPGEKPFKAVIRGLPNTDPNKIEEELRSRYKLAPTAVYRITRRDETKKQYKDVLFLVHFRKGTVTLNALQAVRTIRSFIVTWERYHGGRRDVTQCQRCLNFGHGTRNCHLHPRCGICADKHATINCPLNGAASDDAVTFKCANCGDAHQGSDRRCPKREEFKRIRKQASTTNQPGRRKEKAPTFRAEDFPPLNAAETIQPSSRPAPVWPRRNPPSAIAGAAQPDQPFIQADDDSLFSDEELVILVTEVLMIKRSCRTRSEQLRAVVSIIGKYGN